ncbi:MAG: MFS transporter [Atopostipes sp.]|nr:MFS transporter [Atopostipes sp.]
MTLFLYFIVFVTFLDTFVQLPIITPYAMNLGASLTLTGAIVAIYSLANMIGNLYGGYWIDRYGRKKILITGMLFVFVIALLYPLAENGKQLLLIRFIHGLAGGILIPAVFAYIGDLSEKSHQKSGKKPMAYAGASIGLSAIVGPAVGGIMASQSKIDTVFIMISILFLITALLVMKYLEKSFIPLKQREFNYKEYSSLLKNPFIIQASLAAFSLMLSNGALAFALPLKIETLGLNTEITGLLLSVFGIVALIVFLSPLNRIYDQFRAISLIMSGFLLIALSLFLLMMVDTFFASFLAMVIYGIGFSLIFPSMNQIIKDHSAQINRGKAFGIFYAFFSLGVVIGSSLSGVISEYISSPFLFAGIIMLVTAIGQLILSQKTDDINI